MRTDKIDLELLDEARQRVYRRFGETKLENMWNSLGSGDYFRKIRDLTHVEYLKMKKQLNTTTKRHTVIHRTIHKVSA